MEVPVEVIKEVFVPYEKIVEVPVQVEVERRVEVPYERIVEVEKVVEVPIYIDQYLEERVIHQFNDKGIPKARCTRTEKLCRGMAFEIHRFIVIIRDICA